MQFFEAAVFKEFLLDEEPYKAAYHALCNDPDVFLIRIGMIKDILDSTPHQVLPFTHSLMILALQDAQGIQFHHFLETHHYYVAISHPFNKYKYSYGSNSLSS